MVGHLTTDVARWSQTSPVPSNPGNHPAQVSLVATPSSAIAGCLSNQSQDVAHSPLSTHGLQNVYAETVLLGSDDEDKEIEFSYRTEPLPCSSPPQAGLHGFLGDALISPMSCRQFGFTRDFIHDAGAHFKT